MYFLWFVELMWHLNLLHSSTGISNLIEWWQITDCHWWKSGQRPSVPFSERPNKLGHSEMPELLLPTNTRVWWNTIIYYAVVKLQLKPNNHSKDPTVREIAETVMKNVERIWLKSSIPVMLHKRVFQIIRAYRERCMKFIEPFKGRRNDEKYKAKIKSFREDSSCKLISQLASVYWTVTERSISRFQWRNNNFYRISAHFT